MVAAVLSGNRNFEGRINPQVKANYLASPPLVVAYALAGTVDIDLTTEPLGKDTSGKPVYLRDIWPTKEEVRSTVRRWRSTAACSSTNTRRPSRATSNWKSMPVPTGGTFQWDDAIHLHQEAAVLRPHGGPGAPIADLTGMRVLALLGDSVTTDHISPAGTIAKDSPAGSYLIAQGVEPKDFNSYGARRGNHEVMVRGTLANIRLRNQLAPGTEGGWTLHLPDGEQMFIYDASMRYQQEGVPLLILAGKEYGSGSSRDWAAKGVMLLGVSAVIAESFERIHRTNLVGMGVLPLQFQAGQNAASLGLTGKEVFHIEGVPARLNGGGRKAHGARRGGGRRGEQVHGERAGGHAAGSGVLPQRRHPAVCAAAVGAVAMDPLLAWRTEFPILDHTTYMISHSLGAMPRRAAAHGEFADTWATRGIRAWEEGWWEMPVTVGNLIGRIIGAGGGEVVMHQNVSLCQSIVTSCFDWSGRRNKLVTDGLNFPSNDYIYHALRARARAWSRCLS